MPTLIYYWSGPILCMCSAWVNGVKIILCQKLPARKTHTIQDNCSNDYEENGPNSDHHNDNNGLCGFIRIIRWRFRGVDSECVLWGREDDAISYLDTIAMEESVPIEILQEDSQFLFNALILKMVLPRSTVHATHHYHMSQFAPPPPPPICIITYIDLYSGETNHSRYQSLTMASSGAWPWSVISSSS